MSSVNTALCSGARGGEGGKETNEEERCGWGWHAYLIFFCEFFCTICVNITQKAAVTPAKKKKFVNSQDVKKII